jgi:hypothetical protein
VVLRILLKGKARPAQVLLNRKPLGTAQVSKDGWAEYELSAGLAVEGENQVRVVGPATASVTLQDIMIRVRPFEKNDENPNA